MAPPPEPPVSAQRAVTCNASTDLLVLGWS